MNNWRDRITHKQYSDDLYGAKREWSRWWDFIVKLGLVMIAGLVGALVALHYIENQPIVKPVQAETVPDICGLNDVICEGEVKEPIKKIKYITAYVTKYNKESSCHFPDGKGGCFTASGKVVNQGMVACPKGFLFGRRITIEGLGSYICEDKYEQHLDSIRGYPTFDIFTEETTQEALAWGLRKMTVGIIE
jgi:3D (Asp-Asp-Asp) domain-containing protein